MNRAKLLPLPLPNVDIDTYVQKRFTELNTNSNKTFILKKFGINEHIQPLIEKLALKRPEWRFVAAYGSFNSHDYEDDVTGLLIDLELRDFKVYDKRELLGNIDLGSYSYKNRLFNFYISNDRIRAELSRGNAFKTSNIDKAVKLVLKHFGPRNDEEIYTIAYLTGLDKLNSQIKEKNNMVKRMWISHEDNIHEFIGAHWGEFLDSVADTSEREVLSKLPDIQEEAAILNAFHQQSNTPDNKAYTICQQGDHYIMVDGVNGYIRRSSDELPNNVRHKLGILKLVKDGQAVSDIGFRATENIFIILKGNE